MADAESPDKPLDPAVERVRRRLLRFAVVNLLILFLALAAVVGALFWRGLSRPAAPDETGATIEARLALPAGASVISHSAGERDVSLLVKLADGGQAVLIFSRVDGRLVGQYALAAAP